MDFDSFAIVSAAVVVGNGFTFAFAAGVWAAQRLQKRKGLADDELPLWIYPCLLAAPAWAAYGVYLIE